MSQPFYENHFEAMSLYPSYPDQNSSYVLQNNQFVIAPTRLVEEIPSFNRIDWIKFSQVSNRDFLMFSNTPLLIVRRIHPYPIQSMAVIWTHKFQSQIDTHISMGYLTALLFM